MTMATLVLGAVLNSGGLLAWLMIGLIAGFLASTVMREGGYGMKGTSTLSEISLAYMRRSSSFALHQVLSPLKDHPLQFLLGSL